MTTIKIHNVETNEVIERKINAKALAQWESDEANAATEKQAEATKEAAKAALLAKLGITADEAALLLS